MLDSKYFVTPLDCLQKTLLNGIASPLVVASEKPAFTFQYRYCPSSRIFEAANSLSCNLVKVRV